MPDGEWPQSFSTRPAFGLEFSHSEVCPAWHGTHPPQAMGNGTTTRSPGRRLVTAGPTSTTSPMNSCPSTSPRRMPGT
jgi:hypothetical protein